MKEIRNNLFETKNKKSLSESKIKKTEKNLSKTKKSIIIMMILSIEE